MLATSGGSRILKRAGAEIFFGGGVDYFRGGDGRVGGLEAVMGAGAGGGRPSRLGSQGYYPLRCF